MILAAITISIAWISIISLKFKPCFIHASLLFMSFQMIAVSSLSRNNNDSIPAWIFASGILGIILGLALGKATRRKKEYSLGALEKTKKYSRNKKTATLLIITSLGVAYHYLVGGIPLFSETLMIDRFENTSSGLFGLPGRITLFGTFITFFYATLNHYSEHSNKSKKLAILSVALLATSLALSGNKGNAIQLIAAILITAPYITRKTITGEEARLKQGKISKKTYILAATFAIISFIAVSSIHIKKGDQLYSNPVEALIKRATEVSGQAFYTTITQTLPSEGLGYGSYLVNDISIFLSNFGLKTESKFTTSQISSSYVTGRSLDSGLFLVPVTITSSGYFALEFGLLAPFIFSIFLGLVMCKLYFSPLSNKNITTNTFSLFSQLFIFWFITRGSIGYYAPNMILIGAAYYLLLAAVSSMNRSYKIGEPSVYKKY